jgi:cysteine desulfurase
MDHNGTTPLHPRALAEYVAVSRKIHGNPSTACVVGQAAKAALENARGDVCELLGCRQTELVFTSGATESNIIALRGFCRKAMQRSGQCVIVTTPIEHASVKNTVSSLEEDGAISKYVQVSRYGVIDQNALVEVLREFPAETPIMFAFIWINNEIGTIQDVHNLMSCAARGLRS